MEFEKEARESKDLNFGFADLKELSDNAVQTAMADKGVSVEYNSSYGNLSSEDVTIEGIASILQDVLRDAMYNCIDAGSKIIDVHFGRSCDLELILSDCKTLNNNQKDFIVNNGLFYIRISDDAGKGKLPLIGPKEKPHKGALPMTQYLMTGTVPEKYLTKTGDVNFTTKEGDKGGDGTSLLYEMLDFMEAKGFYDLTEQGTDLYLVFTKKGLL